MFSKILLYSDGSEPALRAVRVAADLSHKYNSCVISLSVYDPNTITAPFIGVPGGSLASATDSGSFADETLNSIEKEVGTILHDAKVKFDFRREFGHAVERIVSAACDEHADLIVIGSRGMGTFQRLTLGSVSSSVLHHAHCAVLVVR